MLFIFIYFMKQYERLKDRITPLLVGISIAEVSSLDNYSSFPAAITAKPQVLTHRRNLQETYHLSRVIYDGHIPK